MIRSEEKNMRSIRNGKEIVGFVRRGSNLVWQHPAYMEVEQSETGSWKFSVQGNDMSDIDSVIHKVTSTSTNFMIDFIDYEQPLKYFRLVECLKSKKVIFHWIDFSNLTSMSIFGISSFQFETLIFEKCIFKKNEEFNGFIKFKGIELKFIDSPIIQPRSISDFVFSCDNLKIADLSNIKYVYSSEYPNLLKYSSSKFISGCPLLEEIDISGIDVDFNYIAENGGDIPEVVRYFGSCPKLKKIKMTTYFFLALFVARGFDPSAHIFLPATIKAAFDELYVQDDALGVAGEKLAQIKHGTHPNIIVTDVAERSEFWDDINL